jgi:hypothetical protein
MCTEGPYAMNAVVFATIVNEDGRHHSRKPLIILRYPKIVLGVQEHILFPLCDIGCVTA